MVCPVAPLLGLGAVLGGAHTVLVQDRAQRRTSWIVVLALCTGWAIYATASPSKPLRVALEIMTLLSMAGAGARAWWLARHRGLRSPLMEQLTPIGRLLWGCLQSPWVLVANTLLFAMLALQWRGRVQFSATEYTLVSVALTSAIAVQAWRGMRARRRMSALESFAGRPAAAGCPLGFGHSATPSP